MAEVVQNNIWDDVYEDEEESSLSGNVPVSNSVSSEVETSSSIWDDIEDAPDDEITVSEPLIDPTPAETQTDAVLNTEYDPALLSEFDKQFGEEVAVAAAIKYSDTEKYNQKLTSKLVKLKERLLEEITSGETEQTATMLSEQNVIAQESDLYTLNKSLDHPFYKDMANDFNGDGVVTQEDALIKRFKGTKQTINKAYKEGTGLQKFIPTENLQSTDKRTLEDRVIFRQTEYAESIAEKIQAMLNSKNPVTRKLAEKLIDTDLELSAIGAILTTDEIFNPLTALAEVPIHYKKIQENVSKGNYGSAAGDFAFMLLDLAVAKAVVKPINTGVTAMWKAVGSGGKHSRIVNAVQNETELGRKIKKANRALALENKETRTQLIMEFEDRNNVTISGVIDDAGNLEIDTGKVRDTGKETLSDYYEAAVNPDGSPINPFDDIVMGDDPLILPMLNPDKLDMLTNIVADLQKDNAEYFKNLYHPKKNPKGVRMIDKLFELTVNKKLLESEDLSKMLTKYGMSYDDFILGVVGSASDAGTLLAKVGHMKRTRPISVKEISAAVAKEQSAEGLRKFWQTVILRPEGIRRGLMVSSLATASRNLQSGAMRAPMESLGNVMDTALHTYTQDGVAAGMKSLVELGNWQNSFRNLRYIFADQGTAQQFTDYLLDRPQFAEQFSRMFDSIGEIQKASGRGQAKSTIGKGADAILSRGEDLVQALNTPNRWQDHMIRRATFYSEIQRLTKNEWGIDLQDALDQGRLKQIMNDNVGVGLRPEGGRSFVDMIDESVTKALDVTYSKQPDLKAFRTISNGITQSGLTVVVPFPRFMFNGLELMAQYSGGAALPLIRKAAGGGFGKGLNARDRQDISRNLVGIATMYGLYRAGETAFATDKSYEFKDPETGERIDATPQFPVRQIGLLSKLGAAAINGGFGIIDGVTGTEFANPDMTMENDTEFTYKNLAETFLGTNARTGQGNVLIDDMANFLRGIDDPTDEEAFAKKLGRFAGQLASTYLIPLRQLNDTQRAMGIRGTEYKDFNKDPRITQAEMRQKAEKDGKFRYASDDERQADVDFIAGAQGVQTFGQTFSKEFRRGFYQQGFIAPSVEEQQPSRQFLHTDSSNRIRLGTRLVAGLNFKEADSEEVEFLKGIGFGDPTYELGSRNRNKKMQARENQKLRESLSLIVSTVEAVTDMEGYKPGSSEYFVAAKKHTLDMFAEVKSTIRSPNANAVQGASDKLRRMKRTDLRYAIQKFKENNKGKNPNLSRLIDLETLLSYGKSRVSGGE